MIDKTFNRTILECKSYHSSWIIAKFDSFNRTILECKNNGEVTLSKDIVPLIELY